MVITKEHAQASDNVEESHLDDPTVQGCQYPWPAFLERDFKKCPVLFSGQKLCITLSIPTSQLAVKADASLLQSFEPDLAAASWL